MNQARNVLQFTIWCQITEKGKVMEDRYLFKAKRLDNGEWIVGYLYRLSENNPPFIMLCNKYGQSYEVDEHTICQCTGLRDKNGKLIYEGDIVKCLYNYYGENGVYIGKVIYREDTCCFVDANSESTDYEWWEEEKEVIGNIFDNKELLESEE